MPTRMNRIDREFTPAEAAAVTGVSVDLQRDWRRRGILPENKDGKWTRFSLEHIIRMAVMKSFSDSGHSVLSIADFASMAILPVLELMHHMPGAIEFEGDPVDDKIKKLAVERSVVGASGRYLVMTNSQGGREPSIRRFDDLRMIDEHLDDKRSAHCTILSFRHLADSIAAKAGMPLVRIEVENVDTMGGE